MQEINLRGAHKNIKVQVDDDVYEWAKDIKWYFNGGRIVSNKGYLHRMILGEIGRYKIYYKDRNPFNNQRENLSYENYKSKRYLSVYVYKKKIRLWTVSELDEWYKGAKKYITEKY